MKKNNRNVRGRMAFVLMGLAMSMSAWATNYVKVSGKDGKAVYFALQSKPVVTFSGDQLVITAGEQTVEYPLTDYCKFELTDRDGTTGIGSTEVSVEQQPVFTIGEELQGRGLKAATVVRVFGADGRLVAQAKVSDDGRVSIPLQGCKGLMIVKTATKSFKLMKR